jgi:hypothetical protein
LANVGGWPQHQRADQATLCQGAARLRGFVDSLEELWTVRADSVVQEVVDALHFEKIGIDVIEKERVEHLSEHVGCAGKLAVLHGAPVRRVRSRKPDDQEAVHTEVDRRPHRCVEPQTAIAVDLVADLDSWEDQGNRSGSEHVVLADPRPANQRMQPQTLGNSNARGRVDEDHGLPGAHMSGAHRERAKRPGAEVLPQAAPTNVPANQGRERGGIEHATRLAAAAKKHSIEPCSLAKAEAEHLRKL